MSRRTLKAASAIREVVSMTILTQLRDPRVQDVTVTLVEVAPDMRLAKVHVSIMGDEKKQRLALKGLQNAAGFLQEMIQRRIDTRYTPRLHFVIDQGVKNSLEVARILDELRAGGELPAAELDANDDLADHPLTDDPCTEDAFADDMSDDDMSDDAFAEQALPRAQHPQVLDDHDPPPPPLPLEQ